MCVKNCVNTKRLEQCGDFLSPYKYLNAIAFQGPQYYFSNLSGQYARIEGTGHWANNAYNGCKGVRCGDMDYFREVQHSDESPI